MTYRVSSTRVREGEEGGFAETFSAPFIAWFSSKDSVLREYPNQLLTAARGISRNCAAFLQKLVPGNCCAI